MNDLAAQLAGKQLLIFDLDGTLVDSSPLHARAYAEAFAPLGLAVDYDRISGMTTDNAIDQLLSEGGIDLGADERTALRTGKQARALALIESELQALPDANAFVQAARLRFACALCTSASPPSVAAALERTGMAGWFDPVVTSADVARGKPDPEGFLLAAHRAGFRPAEALVFEDSESGLSAAVAAGMAAIRIGPGHHHWAELLTVLESGA